MLSLGSPESYISPRVYRFAGVELDVERLQLRVDGGPTACSRKAFELLLLLCSAPQTVLPRQQLLDALWPGGQVISDEALTQVTFRARAALGPYSGLIATVRGIGLRLDAAVITHDSNKGSVAAEPAVPLSESPLAAVVQSRATINAVRLSCLVLLAAAAAYFGLRTAEPVMLNSGFGITAGDILSTQPDTASLLVEAFQNEAHGERARGATLLEAVHRNDQSTPIPALFMALWSSGTGADEAAHSWLDQALARLGENTDLYLNLLLDYAMAEVDGSPDQVIQKAGALLNLRPDAWRMHLARAHLMEYSGMREAALKEITQIKVDQPDDRKLTLTIADRASMGDVEGAQKILDELLPVMDQATHAFLSGRVAWSRGDFSAAYTHFREASNMVTSRPEWIFTVAA